MIEVCMRTKNLLLCVISLLCLVQTAGAAAQPGLADFSQSNAVSVVFGPDEKSLGLNHLSHQNDGRTVVEGMDGVPARKGILRPERSAIYYYFTLDPGFKGQDVRRVQIEVEYFDPAPGTMGIHYDSTDAERGSDQKYMEARSTVTLTGSGRWQKVVFQTRNDAVFLNRQNGGADFRLWAKTPTLYVSRVTVTRDPLNASWAGDFSKSDRVTLGLGQEKATDGLRHLIEERDGQTVATNFNGEPCRYLNRMQEGRPYGSFYFQISPSFKSRALKNSRVEVEYISDVEYLGGVTQGLRLQYDGRQGGLPVRYLPVLAEGATVMRYPTGTDYGKIPSAGTWHTAIFHLTNAVFQNSQKAGADFRVEVAPPELYIRRVTVIRGRE
jgi:hypothetical protein